jgi:hypothetical protein
MKKLVLLTLAVALCAVPALFAAENDAYGHTFFTVRPQFQSEMPEKITVFRHMPLARDCGWGGAIQAVPFGGRSTNSKKLGKYFNPIPSNTLVVESNPAGVVGTAADEAARADGRNVNPAHFNISYGGVADGVIAFTSTFSFRPRQTVVGAGFEWQQYIGGWNDDCCQPRWWFDIAGPVERVQNDMRLSETVTLAAGATLVPGATPNMATAFMGTTGFLMSSGNAVKMMYGLVATGTARRKTGFADLEFKLGYDWLMTDCAYLRSYFGFVAPTGNKPKAVYILEPIVGNNKHWGVMTGGYAGFELWSCNSQRLCFEVALNCRYLFQNTQTRSFDLKARPWSRYMLVFANATDAAAGTITPGINVFTQKVKVNPHFQYNYTMGLVYEYCRFQAEVGYNFWARQEESVRLNTPWVVGPAIYGFATGDTNLLSNIAIDNTASAVPYTTINAVQQTDIDFLSMSHPAALSHIVYGSLGYNFSWCWPIFIGVGGSYEFSTNNVALTRWLAWGKIGISI